MMELIDKLESFVKELDEKYDGDPLVKRGVLISISEAKTLLELEKKQIVDAFNEGEVSLIEDGETYYQETYKQQ